MKLTLILLIAAMICAADGTGVDLGTVPSGKANERAASLAHSQMLARRVTIAPGTFQAFETSMVYDVPIDHLCVSVQTVGERLGSLRFMIAWGSKAGDMWTATDKVLGNALAFTDHGGFRVNSYGTMFKIVVFNDGAEPVTIGQLQTFAAVR